MAKKETSQEVKIIIQYEKKTDTKDLKSLQQIMQELFNSYITKVIQNMNKGK